MKVVATTMGQGKRAVALYDEWLVCQAAGKDIRKNSILVNMIAGYEQACAVVLTPQFLPVRMKRPCP